MDCNLRVVLSFHSTAVSAGVAASSSLRSALAQFVGIQKVHNFTAGAFRSKAVAYTPQNVNGAGAGAAGHRQSLNGLPPHPDTPSQPVLSAGLERAIAAGERPRFDMLGRELHWHKDQCFINIHDSFPLFPDQAYAHPTAWTFAQEATRIVYHCDVSAPVAPEDVIMTDDGQLYPLLNEPMDVHAGSVLRADLTCPSPSYTRPLYTSSPPQLPPSGYYPANAVVRVGVSGSSFLLNQIRHMIGSAILVARGIASPDTITAALQMPRYISMPKVRYEPCPAYTVYRLYCILPPLPPVTPTRGCRRDRRISYARRVYTRFTSSVALVHWYIVVHMRVLPHPRPDRPSCPGSTQRAGLARRGVSSASGSDHVSAEGPARR